VILRKPYAFLIKHFRKINFILLLLAVFVIFQSLSILDFVNNYVDTSRYLESSPITDYINKWFLGANLIIIVLSIVLIYLLKFKDKPIKTYVLIVVSYIFIFGVSIYSLSHFNNVLFKGYDKALALIVRDLNFIMSLPQYLIIILLLIRALGIDLKSFGFKNDKEFLITDRDNEEIEVEASFDFDKYKRMYNKFKKELYYFLIQHKFRLIIAFFGVILIVCGLLYKYFMIDNRIYNIGQDFNSNNYVFNVSNAYITNRDYKGDIIREDKTFVILDINVKNTLGRVRNIDMEKFILYVGDKYYIPNKSYNTYFSDLGNLYVNQKLDKYARDNYYLIYEIDLPSSKDNFILKYQSVNLDESKLIRVKLRIRDISGYVTKGYHKINENMIINVNNDFSQSILINSYEIGDSYSYIYHSCYMDECTIKEGIANSKANKKILYIKTSEKLLDFIKKYGKIKYIVDGVEYLENIDNSINTNYNGNYLYLDVNERILNASNIQIVFTVRSYQYFYVLK